MTRRGLLLACSAGVLAVAAAPASGEPLQQARLEQRLGARVPLELAFRDEAGRTVRLNDAFGRRPVVLTFAYFGCSQLCTDVLKGLKTGLGGLPPTLEYEVLVVSIDPEDSPVGAAMRRKLTFGAEARPNWHFLTGGKPAIRALTAATGFHYAPDRPTHQFAHPAGAMVLTPKGRLSRYFYGIEFAPAALQGAIEAAREDEVGPAVPELLLRCFHDVFASGRYGRFVDVALRLGCSLTVLALLIGLALGLRGERRRAEKGG